MGNIWRSGKARSRAIGVNPKQADRFTAEAQKQGIDVVYDRKTGDAVFGSRKARAQECQRRGVVDYDGGYAEDKYRR